MKNAKLGMLCSAFFGSIFGTVGTIFVMKKLNKLEYKRDVEEQQKHLDEVYKFYENKIKSIENKPKKEEKETKTEDKKEADTKAEVNTITNPKALYQDRLAEEELAKTRFDYSKISKEQYTDLKKEYDREPIIEENVFPHLITQDSYEHAGGYVKEEVIYYEQNGIFATLDDMVVDHLTEEYFGLDNLSLFGSEQASLDHKSSLYELYLRDEVIHTDYHIIYNGTEDFDHLGDCR